MAPRKVPRSAQNLKNDKPRRSRNSAFLEEAELLDTSLEVPFYLVAPKARTKKELMKKAAMLRSGSTGYGCPVGTSGVITYPLNDKEKELLNSMSGGGLANDGGNADAQPLNDLPVVHAGNDVEAPGNIV